MFLFFFSFVSFFGTDLPSVLNVVTQQVQLASSSTTSRTQVPLLLPRVWWSESLCRHTEACQGKLSALRPQGLVQVSILANHVDLHQSHNKKSIATINELFLSFVVDVCTVTWCSEPSKDKRRILRRNTVTFFINVMSVQLPLRPRTPVKYI